MNVPKPVLAVFTVLAVALIGMNITLLRQERTLTAVNGRFEASAHLNIGDRVSSFSGTTPAGSVATITYGSGGPKTLLLVFSPSCGVCAFNWPAWQSIMNQIDLKRTRLIGVSLESTGLSSQYLQQVGIVTKAAVILVPDVKSFLGYRLRYTPQTILIGSDGKVEGVWSGALKPKQIREVEQESLPQTENRHVSEMKGARSPWLDTARDIEFTSESE